MKKIWIPLMLLLCGVLLLGTGCQKGQEEITAPVYYTVSFNTAGGTELADLRVAAGNKIKEPEIPERDGYVFNGWTSGGVNWNFGTDTVQGNMTLVARWSDAKTVFDYEIAEGQIIITGYKGSMKDPAVPSAIDNLPVTAVADNAFAETASESVHSITLAASVTRVGNSAFQNCTGVILRVRGALTSVGEAAFFGCDALSEITLGEGMTEIPYNAFGSCTGLTEVVLPESLTVIGENAFDGCTALRSVMLSGSPVVQDSAFLNCTALMSVFHRGTAEQWAAADIRTGNSGNDALQRAAVYYFVSEKPADGSEGYWYYNEKGEVRVG